MTPKDRIVAITCLLASVATFGSGTASAAPGWTNAGVITEIDQQPAQYGQVFVTASVTGNPSGCQYPTFFYLSISDERQKRMFAMLLTAQAAGLQVRIYVTTVDPSMECVWGAARLDGVKIVS